MKNPPLVWAWRYTWCLTSKCILWQPTMFCWLNLENFPWNYMLSMQIIGFNNSFPTYPRLCKWDSLYLYTPNTFLNHDLTHGTIDKHVEGIMECLSLDNPWQPNAIKIHIWWSQEGFYCSRVEVLHLLGENVDTSTSRIFSNTVMNCIWSIDTTTTHDHCCLPHLNS